MATTPRRMHHNETSLDMKQYAMLFAIICTLIAGVQAFSSYDQVFAEEGDEVEYDADQYDVSPRDTNMTLDDSAIATENSFVIFNILANDRKEAFGYDEMITIESVSQPSFGEVSINSDNTLTYAPYSLRLPSGTMVSDSFQYFATLDENEESQYHYSATVHVQILQENDTPLTWDSEHSVAMNGRLASYLPSYDPDGDGLLFSIVSQPMFGLIEIDATTGRFQYEPYLNHTGPDSFTYTTSDGVATSQVAKVELIIAESLDGNNMVIEETPPHYDSGDYQNEDDYSEEQSGNQTEGSSNVTSSGSYQPVAIAGEEIDALAGEQVMLDGSSSYDPGGADLTYSWSQVEGPNVFLSGSTSASPVFIAPDVEASTTITLRLEVSNAQSTSEPSYVSVVVSAITSVEIDIMPGVFPNDINTNKDKENIPVAILASTLIDESDYDLDSFRFGPNSAYASSYETTDVNGDGIDDIIGYYKIGDLGLKASNTNACLTGEFELDGTVISFSACDSVRVINQNKG